MFARHDLKQLPLHGVAPFEQGIGQGKCQGQGNRENREPHGKPPAPLALIEAHPVTTGTNQCPTGPCAVLNDQGQHAVVAQVNDLARIAFGGAMDRPHRRQGEKRDGFRRLAGQLDPVADHAARVSEPQGRQAVQQVDPVGEVGVRFEQGRKLRLGEYDDLQQLELVGFVIEQLA